MPSPYSRDPCEMPYSLADLSERHLFICIRGCCEETYCIDTFERRKFQKILRNNANHRDI
jgi:hypothetical protein